MCAAACASMVLYNSWAHESAESFAFSLGRRFRLAFTERLTFDLFGFRACMYCCKIYTEKMLCCFRPVWQAVPQLLSRLRKPFYPALYKKNVVCSFLTQNCGSISTWNRKIYIFFRSLMRQVSRVEQTAHQVWRYAGITIVDQSGMIRVVGNYGVC